LRDGFERWKKAPTQVLTAALDRIAPVVRYNQANALMLWRMKARMTGASEGTVKSATRISNLLLAYSRNLYALRLRAWRSFRKPVDGRRAGRLLKLALASILQRQLDPPFKRIALQSLGAYANRVGSAIAIFTAKDIRNSIRN
jgi:hypothetical protein